MAKRQAKTTGKQHDGVAVEVPGPTDVLFGRGGHVNHNPANQKYLTLVMERKDHYHSCKKTDKASIAWDIMAELRQQDPPSRFLKKDYSNGLWYIVPDHDVRRKISQCLREKMVPVIPTPKNKNKARRNTVTKKKASPVVTGTPVSKRATRSSTRIQIRGPREEEQQSEQEEELSEEDTMGDEEYIEEVSFESPEEQAFLASVEQELSSSKPVDGSITLPPLTGEEPARKRSSYYSLTTGTWKDYNPETGSWEDGPDRSQRESIAPPPPPMPKPTPMRSAEGSNSRVWSEVFSSSMASLTPSIFDFSSSENAWESLLDPSVLPQHPASLPQLMRAEEDEESFMESHSSSSSNAVENNPQRLLARHAKRVRSGLGDDEDHSEECISPSKRRKVDASDSTPVDAFFDCQGVSLGKALKESRSLSQSSE